MSNLIRNLPSVNELLEKPPLKSLVRRLSHNVVVSQVGRFLDGMRSQVQSAATAMQVPTPAELAQRIADWISTQQTEVRPVINATGILLHPELGGPPLASEAIQAAAAVAGSYASLEIDLASGESAPRMRAAQQQLTRLTGAEAAIIVSTHAGASLLSLAALAGGREVLVSRGQLVEIPGSHRLPEVIAASGAVLREVGTTNSTKTSDISAAIGEKSAAILHVQTGERLPLAELAALARSHKLTLIAELGNGALVDLSHLGVQGEATARAALEDGADIVLLSGDRLLGGPACGIIAGRKSLIQAIEKHPLLPALRADKATIAALAATLRLYQDQALAERSVPLLSLLATPIENLQNRAERIAPQIAATGLAQVEVVKSQARLTPADPPARSLASVALALQPANAAAADLAVALRSGKSSVVAIEEGDRVLLDLRTIMPGQDVQLVAACDDLATPKPPSRDTSNAPAID